MPMQKILVAVIASAIVVVMLSAFGTLTAFAQRPTTSGPTGQPGTCVAGSHSGCISGPTPGNPAGGGSPCSLGTPPAGQSNNPNSNSAFNAGKYQATGSGTTGTSGNPRNPTANSQYDV